MDVDMDPNDGEPPSKRPRRSPPGPLESLEATGTDLAADVRMDEDENEGGGEGTPRGERSEAAGGLDLGLSSGFGTLAGSLLRDRVLTPLTPLASASVPRAYVPPPELSPSLPSSATFSHSTRSTRASSLSYTPFSGTTSLVPSTDVSRAGSEAPEMESGYTSASDENRRARRRASGVSLGKGDVLIAVTPGPSGTGGRRAGKRLKASHVGPVPHCSGDAGGHCAECAAATLTALLERERATTSRLESDLRDERRARQHHQHLADRLHGLLETSQNRLSRERAHNEAMASMWAGRVADLEAEVARLKAKSG